MNRHTPQTLTTAQTRFVNRPSLLISALHFSLAAYHSRKWDNEVAKAFSQYGEHGASISGIARDHFPEPIKDNLRILAHLVTKNNEAGRKARPKGTRFETMNKLARLVCRRDGYGFYGYTAA